ncbi:F1 capsule-anchoring protein precursor [Cedecea neteri]|uniref:F1 capsule-anchoring protein n=1 Tax=Cedecea neteri TaxID=158822 RepID=A0A2X2V4U4_9ENTR|nr:F1 capsule-anchoring protein precursor [Cedecea neteri]
MPKLHQTDTRVTPTKGAVVPATFQTRIGGRALIALSRPGGNPVPFGAIVSLEGNDSPRATGVVGNESEVYMSGLPDNGTLLVQWGDGKQCRANYQLPKEKGLAGVYISQSQCN